MTDTILYFFVSFRSSMSFSLEFFLSLYTKLLIIVLLSSFLSHLNGPHNGTFLIGHEGNGHRILGFWDSSLKLNELTLLCSLIHVPHVSSCFSISLRTSVRYTETTIKTQHTGERNEEEEEAHEYPNHCWEMDIKS